jgi:hypothetical protein
VLNPVILSYVTILCICLRRVYLEEGWIRDVKNSDRLTISYSSGESYTLSGILVSSSYITISSGLTRLSVGSFN